jgi:hypothetical protein
MARFSSSLGFVDASINCPIVLAKFVTADLTFLNELCPLDSVVKPVTDAEHNPTPYS